MKVTEKLGRKFLQAAERGNTNELTSFLDRGFPVNYQSPRTKETALSAAAGSGARGTIRVLIKRNDCDFLLRDYKGRLACELAFTYGEDLAMARLLAIKEKQQARAQGMR